MKKIDRFRTATLGGGDQAGADSLAAATETVVPRGSLLHLLAGGALLALALLAAVSWGSAPAEAAFPGLNGRIACEGQRGIIPNPEIFSVNPDGSDERLLSNNATSDQDPAFSPDGTKIAFAGQRDPTQPRNQDIYVANNDGDLEGPDVQRLTSDAAGERSPSWSPDGTQIVFHSSRAATFSDGGTTPANDVEIYKMSATAGDTAGQPAERLTVSRGQDAIPSWSPDGTKIAWQRLHQGANPMTDPLRAQNLEIWTMNPDGSDQRNVSNNPGSPNDPNTPENENSNGLDRDVRWSPDSAQLAFASTRSNVEPGNQNFEVFKMNRDGTDQTRLTSNLSGDTPGTSGDYDAPNTWSPDGQRILFTTGRSSTSDADEFIAYTMDANAGEAAGLQEVAATNIFVRCDWQAVKPSSTLPLTPPPGGGNGDKADGVRVRPNLTRPFARAIQTGARSGLAVARRSGGKIVVRVRGRMVGNQGRRCGGRIKIGTRAGLRRVASRPGRMGRNCRYSKRYTFPARRLPERLRPRDRTLVLRILVRYQGNSRLKGDLSPSKRVKVRR